VETYENQFGQEFVYWFNEDGSGGCMLKSVWEAEQAAKEAQSL